MPPGVQGPQRWFRVLLEPQPCILAKTLWNKSCRAPQFIEGGSPFCTPNLDPDGPCHSLAVVTYFQGEFITQNGSKPFLSLHGHILHPIPWHPGSKGAQVCLYQHTLIMCFHTFQVFLRPHLNYLLQPQITKASSIITTTKRNVFNNRGPSKQIGLFFQSSCFKSLTGILRKTCCGCFMGNFWKNWATFYFNIWSHWTPSDPWNSEPRPIDNLMADLFWFEHKSQSSNFDFTLLMIYSRFREFISLSKKKRFKIESLLKLDNSVQMII